MFSQPVDDDIIINEIYIKDYIKIIKTKKKK